MHYVSPVLSKLLCHSIIDYLSGFCLPDKNNSNVYYELFNFKLCILVVRSIGYEKMISEKTIFLNNHSTKTYLSYIKQ